ncbi:Pro-Pol polyprotein [Thelohanellus kitauei]|uniref:Pro-Pol polyprotein n=1 Tax=Thelohanellus kitauei TaxID=669202 RepID=A0A0C2MV38_THEKT|nr:Pro-Pol polyprotein [Thelohanellus kitauei]
MSSGFNFLTPEDIINEVELTARQKQWTYEQRIGAFVRNRTPCMRTHFINEFEALKALKPRLSVKEEYEAYKSALIAQHRNQACITDPLELFMQKNLEPRVTLFEYAQTLKGLLTNSRREMSETDALSRSTNAISQGEKGSTFNLSCQKKDDLIRSAHVTDLGHAGIDKTYDFMRRISNWKGLHGDVERVVRNCDSCCRFKPLKMRHRAELRPIDCTAPLESWHSDFIGPLPLTENGNRYILIFVDPFSKWVEAYATSDQTSNTTLKHLKDLIGRFGVPKIIYSDQGSNYESSDFKSFCESHMIKKQERHPIIPKVMVSQKGLFKPLNRK